MAVSINWGSSFFVGACIRAPDSWKFRYGMVFGTQKFHNGTPSGAFGIRFPSSREVDLKDKRIFIRVDFNVPQDQG